MGRQKTPGGGVHCSQPLPNSSHNAAAQGHSRRLDTLGSAPGRFAAAGRPGANVAPLNLEDSVPRSGRKSRNLTYLDPSSQGSCAALMRRAGFTRCADPLARGRRPAGPAQLAN